MQSLLGVHALTRGGHTLPYVREMRAAGLHVPVVLTVDSPQMSWDVKQASPETVTLTRLTYFSLKTIGSGFELPSFNPKAKARELWDDHFGRANVPPDQLKMDTYWLLMNEHDPPPNLDLPNPYLGYTNQALMCLELNEIARAQGMRLAHMGLNCGTPDWGEYDAMFQTGLFQQMADYDSLMVFHEGVFDDVTPINSGWPLTGPLDSTYTDDRGRQINNAAISGYRWSPATWGAPQPGALTFRYRVLYEGLLKPAGGNLPRAVIGEFYAGGGHGHQWPGRSAEGDAFILNVLGRMRWYNDEAARDDYLIGFCPFTVGVGPNEWDRSDYDFIYDPARYESGGGRSAALTLAQMLAPLPTPRPPAPPPAPLDMTARLIAALNSGAPAQVAALYQPNAAHITGQRTVLGAPDIAVWYADLLGRELRGAAFTLVSSEGDGPSRRLKWTAAGPGATVTDGDDTLGLRDGLIQYHYSYFTVQPR